MAGPLRHLAAIRARLIADTDLTALLGTTPSGDPAVYLGSIFDVRSPVYPAITFRQMSGNMGVWATRIIDPGRIVIEFYSKKNQEEPMQLEEMVSALLHVQKTLVSSNDACFHEIRKVDWGTAIWDGDTGAWRSAAIYHIRVSLL